MEGGKVEEKNISKNFVDFSFSSANRFSCDISEICSLVLTAVDLGAFVTFDIIGECLASSTSLYLAPANISN